MGTFSRWTALCIVELQGYVAPCRLHEALDLVKEMARSHRSMQAATLNSLVRALAPSSAPRALRMVSFMTTLGLPTYHMTSIALIGACARQHMSAEALDLYWYVAPLSNGLHMALTALSASHWACELRQAFMLLICFTL